jgi:hypothetical protein
MRTCVLVVGCVALSCGPRVAFEDDDGTWVDDTRGEPPTEPPDPTGMDTGSPQPPEPPSPLCLGQRVVWESEGVGHRLVLGDTRGDGLPELWLVSGALPTSILALVRAGETYDPLLATTFEGFFVALADLNASGRDDAIAFEFGAPPEWYARMSDAMGLPSADIPLSVPLGDFSSTTMAFFDVSDDRRADLLQGTDGMLQIWRGDGAGGFTAMSNTLLEPWSHASQLTRNRYDPRSFAAVLWGDPPGSVVTLLGIAPGDALVRYATSDTLYDPIILDMRPIDSDERPDVVVAHRTQGRTLVDVLLARDDGQLVGVWRSPEIDVAVAGDFDGDGRLDLLWTHGHQSYAVAGLPSDAEAVPVNVDLVDLADLPAQARHHVADLDGDGRDEIVQLRAMGDTYTVEIIEAVDCG